ncbi:hypothetical protein D3C86_1370960 [compost metagenome]
MLAAALLIAMGEGGQDGHRRVKPGKDVGQRHPNLDRPGAFFTFRAPGDTHQATQALDHEVVASALGIRPRLAKTRNRAIDEIGVERLEARVVETIGRQATDLEVLDKNIGLRRQLADQALALRLGKVDGHRLFVAIGRQVVGSLTGVFACGVLEEGRPPGARIVTTAGALHLDHLGPEIRQYLPGPWPGQYSRQVQHPQMR